MTSKPPRRRARTTVALGGQMTINVQTTLAQKREEEGRIKEGG